MFWPIGDGVDAIEQFIDRVPDDCAHADASGRNSMVVAGFSPESARSTLRAAPTATRCNASASCRRDAGERMTPGVSPVDRSVLRE